MRLVVPDPADRIGWHETAYVDRAGAFERDSIKFLVLEHHVLAILALIAFDLVFVTDRLAGLGIDIAGMDAVARRAVERVEPHFLGLGSGRQHRHRTSHERQLQISLPGRSWRHANLLQELPTDCRFSPFRSTRPRYRRATHASRIWPVLL